MGLLLDAAYLTAGLLASPWLIFKYASDRRFRHRLGERFGALPRPDGGEIPPTRMLLLHHRANGRRPWPNGGMAAQRRSVIRLWRGQALACAVGPPRVELRSGDRLIVRPQVNLSGTAAVQQQPDHADHIVHMDVVQVLGTVGRYTALPHSTQWIAPRPIDARQPQHDRGKRRGEESGLHLQQHAALFVRRLGGG